MITLTNKFIPLQEIFKSLTLDDEYENFVNAHTEAATAECIPSKLRAKYRVPWKTLTVRKNETRKQHPYVIKGTQLVPIPRNLRRHK